MMGLIIRERTGGIYQRGYHDLAPMRTHQFRDGSVSVDCLFVSAPVNDTDKCELPRSKTGKLQF